MVSNGAKTILAGWVGLCLAWFYEHPTQFFYKDATPLGSCGRIGRLVATKM
jgi:hypothetical protein